MPVGEQNIFGVTEELLQEITTRIVREWHPHKIILFGSYAWGQPKHDSDLDLLIIMDSSIARRDMRAMQIRRSLRGLRCPVDLLVYTPQEITKGLQRGNLFISEILERGRLLHAKENKLRKIHDLVELHEACVAIDKDFQEFQEASENLNRYYIDSKYPALGPTRYPLAEAKIAVEQAREILAFTRKNLLPDQKKS